MCNIPFLSQRTGTFEAVVLMRGDDLGEAGDLLLESDTDETSVLLLESGDTLALESGA